MGPRLETNQKRTDKDEKEESPYAERENVLTPPGS